ncbi:MAG: hypothetical protein IIV97_02770, partial [Oscillospiraceae bacterium]|nr:hypothetical protein [Oscillospiraceae bacterium]
SSHKENYRFHNKQITIKNLSFGRVFLVENGKFPLKPPLSKGRGTAGKAVEGLFLNANGKINVGEKKHRGRRPRRPAKAIMHFEPCIYVKTG